MLAQGNTPTVEQERLTRSRRELFKLFLGEKQNPTPFYEAIAARTFATFPFAVDGRDVLDLGCGPGHYTTALRRAGALVRPIDADESELTASGGAPGGAMAADARLLPVRSASFDGVFFSNLLEHSPDTERILSEIGRVLRPGGWAWVAWTNGY